MLVYGGLLLVVILALLGIVLLLRGTKHTARKAKVQEPSPAMSASAMQTDPLSQDTQVSKAVAHQSSPALQAGQKMEGIDSSSTFSLTSNVTSVQSLPRVEAIPLVTRSTGVAPEVKHIKHMPHAARLTKMDDDRIVLTSGQFGALLSELNALRQRSEEVAERLDIVSETLEQMAPTQIEFPAVSFKPSPTPDTPGSARRGRRFIS